MIARAVAAVAAAEPLLIAAVIGVGVHIDSAGLVAFGLAWAVPVTIDRIRRKA